MTLMVGLPADSRVTHLQLSLSARAACTTAPVAKPRAAVEELVSPVHVVT
jgi:hypothetical protein